MRVVKEPIERKNEILDVAEYLFSKNGFDKTSTNDILSEVGIARGTLYYHFKSKEDILDCLIDRIIKQMVSKASIIAKNKSVPVLERVSLMIMALNVDSDIGSEVIEQVHKPQNALMHQKMEQQILKEINPLITDVLKEGIQAGLCNTSFLEESVDMIMIYSNTAFHDIESNSEEIRQRKIEAFTYNIERLLGMKNGSMQEAIIMIFKNMENN